MTARPAVEDEIELTDEDIEYVDWDQYSDGEVTSEFVLDDGITPVYCRSCVSSLEKCRCRR